MLDGALGVRPANAIGGGGDWVQLHARLRQEPASWRWLQPWWRPRPCSPSWSASPGPPHQAAPRVGLDGGLRPQVRQLARAPTTWSRRFTASGEVSFSRCGKTTCHWLAFGDYCGLLLWNSTNYFPMVILLLNFVRCHQYTCHLKTTEVCNQEFHDSLAAGSHQVCIMWFCHPQFRTKGLTLSSFYVLFL